MSFGLRISDTAKGQIRRLDRDLQRRIVARLEQLCVSPVSPPMSDWVEGTRGLRRTRVGGWRVLFTVDMAERVVDVVAVRPRGQAYRGL